MTKLDIRVGDVVRLKPMKVHKLLNVDTEPYLCLETADGEGLNYIEIADVESIISRAETDAEKIARLEAENAGLRNDVKAAEAAYEAELAKAPRRIEWNGGECPVDEQTFVAVWKSNGTRSSDRAGTYRWSHSAEMGWVNIIAYMVLPS